MRERLSHYEQPPKDSHNSSIPPSKEHLKSEVNRRTKSLRKKSDKPIGGQKGHEGHFRDMVEESDEIIDHISNYCTQCGRDLSGIESVLEYVNQEIDIPAIQPVIREHHYYGKVCSCGCSNRSYEPCRRGGNAVTFGTNIQTLVVYYNVVQCIPYARLQSMLRVVFGIEMSQGTISNIIQKATKKSLPAIALLKERISNSSVVGFDESGCYCNRRLDWSWIAQTLYHILVFRASGRSGQVLEDMFGDTLKMSCGVCLRRNW